MWSRIMEDIKKTHIQFLEMKNILDRINGRAGNIEEKLWKQSNRNHPKGNTGRKKLEEKKERTKHQWTGNETQSSLMYHVTGLSEGGKRRNKCEVRMTEKLSKS